MRKGGGLFLFFILVVGVRFAEKYYFSSTEQSVFPESGMHIGGLECKLRPLQVTHWLVLEDEPKDLRNFIRMNVYMRWARTI